MGDETLTTEDVEKRTEIGLLLPHFSNEASWERLIGFCSRIENYGFDSVWVRDNLNYRGHSYELPGRRFIDPFVTLSAVAARTERLLLGTAVLVPYRHPLITAQMVASLAWVSRGRLQLGVGPGAPRDPFDLTGVPYENRVKLCREMVGVLRAASSSQPFSYKGDTVDIEDVVVDPAVPEGTTIWYGGASKASIRRAVTYCDGLLPGRCPFDHLDGAIATLEEHSAVGRRDIRIGTIPLVLVAESYASARMKLDAYLPSLLPYLSKQWRKDYESFEDTAGAVICGSPAEVEEQILNFLQRPLDLVVLDARLQMNEFEHVVSLLAEAVLPVIRREQQRVAESNQRSSDGEVRN